MGLRFLLTRIPARGFHRAYEVILDRETVIENEHIDTIIESGAKSILVHKENQIFRITHHIQHHAKGSVNSEKEAVVYIYRQLRNSEPPDEATARDVIDKLFFSGQTRYDLGEGRTLRINKKLNLSTSPDIKVLTEKNIIEIIKYLIDLSTPKLRLTTLTT